MIRRRERNVPTELTVQTDSAQLEIESHSCNVSELRKAGRRLSQFYDMVLAPSGLKATQRSILVQVARIGSPTIGQLALALVLHPSALNDNLKPLERDGLVARVVADHDRRSRVVHLTPRGARKLAQSRTLWMRAQKQFEGVFGANDAATLRSSLRSIASLEFLLTYDQVDSI
jgi:DNA-binding MarR family transcriptional regulator